MTARRHTHTLTFLGTGASCGVPSFYCGCKACEEAQVDPRAARDCSGILIAGKQNTLIDAAPELRRQLVREGISRIDQALFTHGHFDHLGGIPQLEFYVRVKTKSPLPIYTGEQTIATIKQQYSFMLDTLDIHLIRAFETICLDGVSYTALPAAHCKDSYGFLIEVGQGDETAAPSPCPSQSSRTAGQKGQKGDGSFLSCIKENIIQDKNEPSPFCPSFCPSRTAYFPDTGPLPPETLEYLQDLDNLIIDSTFSGKNWMPATHHSIDEAIALAELLKPRRTLLTHLAMHFDEPITLKELEHKLLSCESVIQVAYDGLSFEL